MFMCIVAFAKAQYFNAEDLILNSISFHNARVNSLYHSVNKQPVNVELVLNRLNKITEDSLSSNEDIANLYILKALFNLHKHYIKNTLLNGVYAKKNALKSNDPVVINNANLLLALTDMELKSPKKMINDLKECHFTNPIAVYEVEYLKAQAYSELQEYDNLHHTLIELIPLSKSVSKFDYIHCLSFLVSTSSQNNMDSVSLKYALKLDTVIREAYMSLPIGMLNSKINYVTNETGNLSSYLMLQKIINENNIGFLYRKLGNYRSSENYLLASISDLKKYKNETLYPEIKMNIGLTYTHLKRYADADVSYHEALKKYVDLKNGQKQGELYTIIAKNYLLANSFLSAIENCNTAVALASERNDYLNLSNAYFILSEVYALNSDYKQSQAYFKLFTEAKNKYDQIVTDKVKYHNEIESNAAILHLDVEDEISDKEKKSMELVRVKLESKQKEQELLLIKQENELKEKTITAQALEKEQALKSLELIRGQLENEKLTKEYEKINKEKEIKGLENEKNKNEIKLLNSQKKIFIIEKSKKDLQIQNTRRKQQYLTFGLVLLGFFLALISFGFYTNYRQRKTIENANDQLKRIGENLQSSNVKLEESVTEINEQKKIIEDKNRLIIDSINYSLRIQKSFLFKEEKMTEYFKECFVISKPKDIVSGDFYFVTKKEHKIYIAVVDCTGHGVPGALISVIGYEELKHLIEYNDYELPEVLAKLDRKINETLNLDNTVGSDGMDLMLVEIDTQKQSATFCGAKAMCFLSSNNEFIEIKGDRKSIGEKEIDHNFKFTKHVYPFYANDMLYLFTDGFSDQFGNEGKKKMGTKVFKTALSEVRIKALSEQKTEMESLLLNWQGNVKQTDDITLIGIKL